MTQKSFVDLLNKWIEKVRVVVIVNGSDECFTFHFFRRGILQYWFLHGVRRKISAACAKWWGGQSENEKIETAMKYLLNDLSDEEINFKNIIRLL